jgi:hypothetical protein
MPRWISSAIGVTLLALTAIPTAFIITLLLYPLWSWIEATYGVESVGHSGPADWCFMTVYIVLLACAFPLWRTWRRHRERGKVS